jgi:hypothetical protein
MNFSSAFEAMAYKLIMRNHVLKIGNIFRIAAKIWFKVA